MKLLDLKIQNFGPFQGTHVVDLEAEGLIAIDGVNKVNPGQGNNGAGKSSILDALLWGLYGETGPRKETASNNGGLKSDDVVNEVEGGRCIVTVIFEQGGDQYRIERWRKARSKDELRLKANGVRLDMSERGHGPDPEGWHALHDLDQAPAQEEIDQTLGIDYQLALKLLIRSQEDLYNFAQSTAKERFAILTQIEGLDDLDTVERKARDRGLEVLKEINRLTGEVSGAEQTLALFQQDDPTERAQAWEQERSAEVNRLAQHLEQLKSEDAQLEPVIATKSALIAKLAELDDALRTLVTQAEPAEVAQWREVLAAKTASVGGFQTQVRLIEAKLAKISKQKGVCVECGQVVGDDHIHDQRSAAERELSEAQASLAAEQEAQAQAKQVVDSSMAEMERYRQAIQQQRDQVNAERNVVNQQIYQVANAEERRRQITALVKQATDSWTRKAAAPNPHHERAEQHQQRVEQLQADLEGKRAQLASFKTEAGLVEWWARAVPSIKSWIFDNVVGEITTNANRWLQHFMAGTCFVQVESTSTTKGGKVKDEVGLRLYRWEHNAWHERPFRRWSGGEKRRIAVAIDWALADRLAQRSKFRCSFMALDEVDRHIDDEGKNGLLQALSELRQEKQTIWVISQDKDFNAAPDVVWTVVKDEQGSRIEVRHEQGKSDQEQREAA